MVYFARIPLLIELGRLCLEYNKHELAADCLENLKGGVKVILSCELGGWIRGTPQGSLGVRVIRGLGHEFYTKN